MKHIFRSSFVSTLLPVAVLAASALTPVLAQTSKIAQTEVRLEPTPLQPPFHDQFGTVTAASANGNTLAVAGITADNGTISEVGAIFIFDRIDDKWVQTARLFPTDGVEDETLGFDMAMSEDGNTVVAGELIHNGVFFHEGALYVFHRSNGVWIQEAELISPTPGNNQIFGSWGVSVSGDTLVAGDLGGPSNGFTSGIDVFKRVNGVWQLSAILQLPDDFDFSPTTVAIKGSTIVMGNSGGGIGGVVFVFGVANGQWTLQAKLSPNDATTASQFGSTVVVDGNSVFASAPAAPGASAFTGAVYVFARQGAGWVQTAKVTAADGVSGDGFGFGLDAHGGTMAVGAQSHPTSAGFGAGVVYLLQFKDGKWTQSAQFSGSDVAAGGNFGFSVSLKNDVLLVGAPGQHPQPNNVPYPEGEAYIYSVN
jgi:hypothetical protein